MQAAVLSALAVAALCMSAESGSRMITLCVSSSGHLDLKHVVQSCHDGHGGSCRGGATPLESTQTAVPGQDTCCNDIPLMVDLVGWPAPRSLEDGDDDDELLFADQVRLPDDTGVTTASPGGPRALPAPDREPPTLAALASVVLLL